MTRPMSIIAILAALPAIAGAAEDWKASRTWICGTQFDTWVVAEGVAQGPASLPVVQMWNAGPKSDPSGLPEQKPVLSPISGRILEAAADAAALRLIFTDLSIGDYFPQRPWAAGANWNEQSVQPPLAWGADVSDAFIYAVVRSRALVPLTSRPADEETSDDSPRKKKRDNPEFNRPVEQLSGITVLTLHHGAWRRIPGPTQAFDGEEFWISGREGQVCLFYRRSGEVFSSVYSDAWSEPKTVCSLKNLKRAWAAATAQAPVWIAAIDESADAVHVHTFVLNDGAWQDLGPAREGPELLAIDPQLCGAGIGRGKLVISRPAPDGSVEFGYGDLGPTPLVRFSTLSLRRVEPALEQQWQDTIVLLILLGIMTLVLWTRWTEIARQIVLPPELAHASVWKRVMATGVDLIPAMLLVAPWWWPKLQSMRADLAGLGGEQLATMIINEMHLEIYSVFLAHGAWTFVFESLKATTPGKMLMALRVMSTDGSRPNIRQCLIRSATRSIMLSLGSSGLIVTLMTILIVSRNRQRLGDLLARTIVVEPAQPTVEEGPPSE